AYNDLGVLLKHARRPDEAVEAFRQARPLLESLAPDHPDHQSLLGAVLNNLALLRRQQGRLPEARRLLEQAVGQQRAALQVRSRPQAREHLANHYLSLGGVLSDLEEHGQAEQAYRQALAAWKPLAEGPRPVPDHRCGLAKATLSLGVLCART